jgi:hypothetical protein
MRGPDATLNSRTTQDDSRRARVRETGHRLETSPTSELAPADRERAFLTWRLSPNPAGVSIRLRTAEADRSPHHPEPARFAAAT